MTITHSTPADASFSATGQTAWDAAHTVADNTLIAAKLSATAGDVLFGRSTVGAGAGEEVPFSAFLTPAQGDADYQPLDADLISWAGVTRGTGFDTAAAVNVGSAGAVVVNGGALGTPSSGTLTNATGLLVTGGGTGSTTAQGARTNLEAGYAIELTSALGASNPIDGQTRYTGALGLTTLEGVNKVRILRDGTIKKAYIMFVVTGTLGSTEQSTVSIRLNGATDTTISSVVQLDQLANDFSNTALSIAVVEGDYFEIKWVQPTWATNPTGVYFAAQIYVE